MLLATGLAGIAVRVRKRRNTVWRCFCRIPLNETCAAAAACAADYLERKRLAKWEFRIKHQLLLSFSTPNRRFPIC